MKRLRKAVVLVVVAALVIMVGMQATALAADEAASSGDILTAEAAFAAEPDTVVSIDDAPITVEPDSGVPPEYAEPDNGEPVGADPEYVEPYIPEQPDTTEPYVPEQPDAEQPHTPTEPEYAEPYTPAQPDAAEPGAETNAMNVPTSDGYLLTIVGPKTIAAGTATYLRAVITDKDGNVVPTGAVEWQCGSTFGKAASINAKTGYLRAKEAGSVEVIAETTINGESTHDHFFIEVTGGDASVSVTGNGHTYKTYVTSKRVNIKPLASKLPTIPDKNLKISISGGNAAKARYSMFTTSGKQIYANSKTLDRIDYDGNVIVRMSVKTGTRTKYYHFKLKC